MKYSLVMASRNRRKELSVALPTMMRQSPSEIVFVDDGSTDSTEGFIKGAIDPARLIYHRIDESTYKANPAAVWNLAVSLASHENIVMCCPECAPVRRPFPLLLDRISDDTIAIARTYNAPLKYARRNRNSELLRGPDWDSWSPGNTPSEYEFQEVYNASGMVGIAYHGKLQVYTGHERPVPYLFCGAFKMSTWERLGGFDETLKRGADYHFALNATRQGIRFQGVGEAVVIHVQHGRM